MRKQAVLLAIFSIVINSLFSQTLFNSKISNQGGVSSSEGLIIEWTLGENLTETVWVSNEIYTQGFHQTYIKSSKLDESLPSFDQIRIFPNPVYSTLTIKLQKKDMLPYSFEIFDTSGRKINSLNISESSSETSINFLELSSGVYFLRISMSSGELVKTFRVIKL